eukprot:Polyplicarium_translucidae@DN2145_c0_g1_i3.p1
MASKENQWQAAPIEELQNLSLNEEYRDRETTCLSALKELQKLHFEIEEEYQKEWNALKLKYLLQFRPLYTQRKDALNAGEHMTKAPMGTRNIPGFWLKAMQHHRMVNEMIELHDEPMLYYLDDIRFEWLDEQVQTSFKLIFDFVENPYFEDTQLTKTYQMEKEESGECVLTSTQGTEIQWHTGKDVTKKKVTKKQRHRRTHQTRIVEEMVENDSFFNLFKSNDIPSEEQLSSMEERVVDDLELVVEAEFEIGCVLRDKVIPRAVGWYLGEERDTDQDSTGSSTDGEQSDDDSEGSVAP